MWSILATGSPSLRCYCSCLIRPHAVFRASRGWCRETGRACITQSVHQCPCEFQYGAKRPRVHSLGVATRLHVLGQIRKIHRSDGVGFSVGHKLQRREGCLCSYSRCQKGETEVQLVANWHYFKLFAEMRKVFQDYLKIVPRARNSNTALRVEQHFLILWTRWLSMQCMSLRSK